MEGECKRGHRNNSRPSTPHKTAPPTSYNYRQVCMWFN